MCKGLEVEEKEVGDREERGGILGQGATLSRKQRAEAAVEIWRGKLYTHTLEKSAVWGMTLGRNETG